MSKPDDQTPATMPNAEAMAAPDLNNLLIGPPFAVAGDAEFLPTDKERGVGSVSCIKCECGHAFRLDLLSERPKVCPGCKATYTHVLVVCRTDDPDMFDDIAKQILHANGIAPPEDPDDDEDDGEDDGEDDDSEDDDGEADDDDAGAGGDED